MDKNVNALRLGALGYFSMGLEGIDDVSVMKPGRISIEGESCNVKIIRGLDEDLAGGLDIDSFDPPEVMVGLTEFCSVALYDVSLGSSVRKFGGGSVSTTTVKASLMVSGVPVEEIESPRIISAEAHFLGVVSWYGEKFSVVGRTYNEDDTAASMTYTLPMSDRERRCELENFSLTLSQGWSAREHRMDEFFASTPLKIKIESRSPELWMEYSRVFGAVQSVMNLAYDSLVCAVDGRVTPDLRSSSNYRSGAMWNGVLMERPEGVRGLPDSGVLPAFGLEDMGGITGLAKWIDLYRRHSRATGPLLSKFRVGKGIAEEQFMSVVVGIVYWVSVNKKDSSEGSDWSRVRMSKKSGRELEVLAIAMGEKFSDFVGGDVKKWARIAWSRYNALKHDPSEHYDINELYVLLKGVRVLLMGALLSHAAGTTKPLERIMQAHQYYRVGLDTTALMGSGPKISKK